MSAGIVAKFPNIDKFLLKKWERSFHNFFDSDAGGSVDWQDFYLVTKKVKNIYGADSEQMRMAHSSLKALFEGLLGVADRNKDKVINLVEWVTLLNSHDPNKDTKWFNDYRNFVFQLYDVSADKKLDICEYVDGMAAYGFVEGDATAAFKKLAVDAKGNYVHTISSDEFKKLWHDYFYGTDPAAPGNHLFGILN